MNRGLGQANSDNLTPPTKRKLNGRRRWQKERLSSDDLSPPSTLTLDTNGSSPSIDPDQTIEKLSQRVLMVETINLYHEPYETTQEIKASEF
ncbi:unnamed protein product [Protopolystoma xenopodis]|uniref:Uncharacterized protein n=1 Tax=Protopolystoma xenopodis TaxID=117903 RepID=A0A3S5CL22_9PLAT|nr:unnamed protein product [Protopolystoma xenopodis]